jgi:hypothetical protein
MVSYDSRDRLRGAERKRMAQWVERMARYCRVDDDKLVQDISVPRGTVLFPSKGLGVPADLRLPSDMACLSTPCTGSDQSIIGPAKRVG